MADIEAFPTTPSFPTFTIEDPAGAQLIRATYLVEEYSRGVPAYRDMARQMARPGDLRESLTDEQREALPDTVTHIGGLFRQGLAEEMLASGDLLPGKLSRRESDARIKAVDETWNTLSTAVLQESAAPAEQSVAPEKMSVMRKASGLTYVGILFSSLTNLDIRAMRHYQEDLPLARTDSVVRENILGRRPASPAFDAGFDALGRAVTANTFADSLVRLEKAWVALHPDEPFLPEAYTQRLADESVEVPRIVSKALGWISRRHAKTADILMLTAEKRGHI